MKNIIGFANHYYTLWSVFTFERTTAYGAVYEVTKFDYIQNLSFDLEKAKAKLAGEEFTIDLDLRGCSSYSTQRQIKAMPVTVFSYGMLTGQPFGTCNDVWQLNRAMKEEGSARRKVLARRRLQELNELFRYTYRTPIYGYDIDTDKKFISGFKLSNWATPRQILYHEKRLEENNLETGHLFNEGQRVKVDVRMIREFSFESQYGTTYIVMMQTKCGKLVKYMGANPVDLSKDEFKSIQGTVKHTEYKGEKETKLQRIKLL